jgi:hypothetical protein
MIMKKPLKFTLAAVLMSILCAGCSTPSGPDITNSPDYYWLGDEKIPLQKMDNKFYVMYDSANEEKLEAEFERLGITITDKKAYLDDFQCSIKGFDAEKFAGIKSATIQGDYEKIAPLLSLTVYWAPYYKTDIGEGRLTNRFSIRLKQDADLAQLEKLAKEHGVEILGENEYGGWYELACSNLSTGNSLEMANLFYETGQFESVSYDLGARGTIWI